jgi:hypothetical protein
VLGLFAAALALGAAFVRHELRTANPMLNLSFFRDPRFSVASMSLGLASFAMFGAVFASTQFLQDANGTRRWRPGPRWRRPPSACSSARSPASSCGRASARAPS